MKKLLQILSMTAILSIVSIVPAWAGSSNVGTNLSNWLNTNVTGLFPPVLAVVSIAYLAKREFTKFIGFGVFAVFVAIFVYAPDNVTQFAKDLAGQLLK